MDSYRLPTPEQVDLRLDVAGLGSRFVAALVDVFIQSVLWLALALFLVGGGAAASRVPGVDDSWLPIIGAVLFTLASFLIVWAYYVFFETIWNGQTPGKRLLGLRVLKVDGQPIGFFEALIRNIVRLADFLPGLYVVGSAVMLLNSRSRRLGDYAAGTLVVKERRDLHIENLEIKTAPRDESSPEAVIDWSALQPSDYVLVREFLMRRDSLERGKRAELAGRIATGLAARMGQSAPADAEDYLEQLGTEYRKR
jgi:uncharacterized RDD family membrane protein YckC